VNGPVFAIAQNVSGMMCDGLNCGSMSGREYLVAACITNEACPVRIDREDYGSPCELHRGHPVEEVRRRKKIALRGFFAAFLR